MKQLKQVLRFVSYGKNIGEHIPRTLILWITLLILFAFGIVHGLLKNNDIALAKETNYYCEISPYENNIYFFKCNSTINLTLMESNFGSLLAEFRRTHKIVTIAPLNGTQGTLGYY